MHTPALRTATRVGALLVAVASCGGEPARIITEVRLQPFQAVLQPVRAVKLVDANHPVAAPADLAILSGRFALVDALQGDVKVFDSTGSFIRAIGRPGDGPGEFRIPARVARAPLDQLIVMDIGRTTISRWDTLGRLLAEWQPRGSVQDLAYLRIDGGRLLIGGRFAAEGVSGPPLFGIQEFDLSGVASSFFPGPSIPEEPWVRSFSSLRLDATSQRVVLGVGVATELHVHDRATGVARELRLSELIPVPREMPSRPMTRLAITEWMSDKAILAGVFSIDDKQFLIQHSNVGPTGASSYRYAIVDAVALATLAVTDWTDIKILHVEMGRAFGVRFDSDGALELHEYSMSEP